MKKRVLCLILSLVLCLSLLPAGALAVEETTPAEPTADQDAQAAWEASLGDFTMTDANAYTPTEAQNLLTAEDTGHAYDPTPAEEDGAGTAAEFVPGEVLYARPSGGVSLFGTDDTDSALAALGVTDPVPVYTSPEGDDLRLMGDEPATTWYRASVSGDVEETVEALKDVSGIVDAEPNYIFTTQVTGEPSAAEIQKAWYLDPDHQDNGLHKGWWKRWWPGMPEDTDWDNFDFEEAYPEDEVPAPGKDVIVAVIDTGVDYTHQDLASSMWVNGGEIAGNGIDDDNNGYVDDVYGINTTANPRFDGAIAGDPLDYNGHGTHVAGIIAMANNGEGGVGAAYGAKIMAVKAGQATGTFSSADIAEAIQYAHSHGADVINMSFGGKGRSTLVKNALEDAFTDCVLVAAAGNDGLPTTDAPFPNKEDIYPAGYNFVIGVMATDKDGNLAGFSNWDYIPNLNAEYELTAPGVDIYSTLPGNRYASWNGTSMAAPCVSSAAAVIRAYFPDKNEYNSRFIMGQLVSATNQTVGEYAKLDLYDSLTNQPKPNLRMAEVFALDNVRDGTANDGDRIMDAGETIDLGLAVRNQWGRSGAITIKADAISIGGVPNPYVTFLTDTVTLDPAGTFQTVDNGFVREDSLLTDVTDPIRFKLADNTPNDTQIQINLTVTTTNGLDSGDTATYTIYPPPTFTFRVQRGAAIRGHISTDTTLTADKYWIVENALLIDEGATLTVEPGTQIQFWSSDYEDAYGGKTMSYINNNGTLNMIGTVDAPIELFPGSDFEMYAVGIHGSGTETLKYCEVINPLIGNKSYYYGVDTFKVELCDHCTFIQDFDNIRTRDLDGTTVNDYWMNYGAPILWLEEMNSCIVEGVRNTNEGRQQNLNISSVNNSLFVNSSITMNYVHNSDYSICDSLFIGGGNEFAGQGTVITCTKTIPKNTTAVLSDVFSFEGATSKYVLMDPIATQTYSVAEKNREIVMAAAESAGGTLLSFEDEDEQNGFLTGVRPFLEATREPGNTFYIYQDIYVDYTSIAQNGVWAWGSGSTYAPSFSNNGVGSRYAYYTISTSPTYGYMNLYATSEISRRDCKYALKFPATLSDDTILNALNAFDVRDWIDKNYPGSVYRSAILNPVQNPDLNTWTRFSPVADTHIDDRYLSLQNNYWGTENSTLINKMIIDDDDYPGTLADIVETPILTLDNDLSMIYPFVTKIWVTEPGGSTIVEDAAPGQTLEIHVTFNRDMDQTVQPTITYGGEAPFTDYGVSGDWTSLREWVGQTKISSVSTGGNMIFQAKGGRADDDHWLVCGTDNQRFQFNINAATAQSAVLNATGYAGRVDLTWIQNDYELLAGYNLFRSTSADGPFTKLNDAVLTGTTYSDTNVDPGVTYYYYFTMVNTDGEEIDGAKSNTAAAALDNVAPTVIHSAVATAKQRQALSLSCQASDNIAVAAVTLYYQTGTSGDYQSVAMTYNSATERYTGSIPAAAVTDAGVQYYIEARDTAGNTGTSGSFALPYAVTADGSVSLLAVSPNTINVNDSNPPATMTVYGANFTEGMTVRVGPNAIESYTVNADGDQISFAIPDLAVGVYAVSVTKDGKTATLSKAVTYRDVASDVRLDSGEGVPGAAMRLPLYAAQTGPLYALRAEIEIPSAAFTSATVEAASDFGSNVDCNWQNDVLTVSMVNAQGYTTSSTSPVAWVVLTPKAVAGQTTVPVTLRLANLNDISVLSAPQIASAVITPNYQLNAQVNYCRGSAALAGVRISAANVTGTTDEAGVVRLTGIGAQQVNVTAAKDGYDYAQGAVNLNDVLLMLRYLVDKAELDENQQLAADVNADNAVTEMDAVAILRVLVQLDDGFASGAWRFVPATQSVTLADNGENAVSFIAILMGDVDGNWKAAS